MRRQKLKASGTASVKAPESSVYVRKYTWERA